MWRVGEVKNREWGRVMMENEGGGETCRRYLYGANGGWGVCDVHGCECI